MSLDIFQLAGQIERLVGDLQASERSRDQSLSLALSLLSSPAVELNALQRKIAASKTTWLVAEPQEALDLHLPSPVAPAEYVAVAADGSHIDVDRHSPARCYLINIGNAVLRYGPDADASLASSPSLHGGEDLALKDPTDPNRQERVEGALLGAKRSIAECQALAELCRQAPAGPPLLAMLDGSLVVWGLSGQDTPEFVKKALVDDGLLRGLDTLLDIAGGRTLALASYISLPGSAEVVNALRVALCPDEPARCDSCSAARRPGQPRQCDVVAVLCDRDLFGRILSRGERSALFLSRSKIVEQRYGRHQVFFFYVNVGDEIARIELPAWAATPPLLEMVHALVLDQCRRGLGYPVALSEAHEQAVLTGPDRALFSEMVQRALSGNDLSVRTSAKSESKRTRWA